MSQRVLATLLPLAISATFELGCSSAAGDSSGTMGTGSAGDTSGTPSGGTALPSGSEAGSGDPGATTTSTPSTTNATGDTSDAGDPTGDETGGPGPVGPGSCAPIEPPNLDCGEALVRCVAPQGDANAEYTSIQEAADASGEAGSVVVVHPGNYAGFTINQSGQQDAPITYYALEGVVIDSAADTGDGIRLQDVSYVTIQGFSIEGPDARCIAARGASPVDPMVGLVITEVRCEGANVEGFYLSEVSESLVQGNVIIGPGANGDTRSHGIYLANAGADNTRISCNSISGASADESNGVHLNGDLSVGGDGIITGVVFYANRIFDNSQNGINIDGGQEITFIDNLIYNNGRHAIRAYAIDGAQGPQGLVAISNTLASSVGSGFKTSEDLGGHVLFNNVLIAFSDEPALSTEDATITADNNGVQGGFTVDGGGTVLSLAQWQGLGHGAGTVVIDPASDFADVGGGDWSLSAQSVCEDAGRDALAGHDAPDLDLAGQPRPAGGGQDIGAYETQ